MTIAYLLFSFLLFVWITPDLQAQSNATTFYVAANGQPGNPGTMDKPFQRPEQAFEAIRNIKGPVNANVYIRGGNYEFSKSLVLSDETIGQDSHVAVSAWQNEKVTFSGGKKLDGKLFTPVTDPNILNRLPAAARGKVYVMDLPKAGITDFGKQVPHGYKVIRTAPLELFYNGKALTVSRYPNSGYLPIGNVSDPGANPRQGDRSNRGATFSFDDSRMNNWKQAHDAWVGGYFSYGYSDDYLKVDTFDAANKSIHLKQAALYAVYSTDNVSNEILRNSQKIRGFYIYNLLEEIDTPGEWYLDESSGLLYVWPPDAISPSTDIEVSMLDAPIVVLSGTQNVSFKNIRFQYSRSMGMLIDNTQHTTVAGCTFGNLGTVAVSTGNQLIDKKLTYHTRPGNNPGADDYNTDLLIQSCLIYNTGTGGVILDGGDRKNLQPARNVIDNCEIANYSRINRTFCPAVSLSGVGNQVTHCYIHDAPDQAIVFYGNDLTISYNRIENVTFYMTDAGAVGTGRDIATTGNTIDYNLFKNITSTIGSSLCALYLDDGSSGMEVDGNVFYKAGTAGTYHFGAIHVNGGSDNTFRNNYFVECQQAFSNSQWKDPQWRNVISDPSIAKVYRPGVDVRSAVYTKKYPYLNRLTDSTNLASRMNYSYNTLAYKVGVFSTGAGLSHKNPVITTEDPGFANIANNDFTLSAPPPALKQASDWKAVPRDIGLKK